MSNVKVSIIVPIYNVERYLDKCLKSLIRQTLNDIEIICVNDGSTDGSLNIVKKYASQDVRVKIIDKKNSGYGNTMNVGLDAANGEYIGIVESDDFVSASMFDFLYTCAFKNNVDVVKSSFWFFWGDKSMIKPAELLSYNAYYKVVNPLDDQSIFWLQPAIWSAVYKRKLIIDNHIRFLETPGASYQDTSFNFKVLALAKKVYLVPEPFLFYRQDNMFASVKNKGKIYCVNEEFAEIDRFLDLHLKLKKQLEPLKNRLKFATYSWNYSRIDKVFKKKYLEKMSAEFKDIMKKNAIDKNMFTEDEWQRFLLLVANASLSARTKFFFKKAYKKIKIIFNS